MKSKSKKPTKKKVQDTSFQPGVITFLIALVSVLALLLLAYLGAIFSA